jgi:hypothetical protein
MASFIFKVGVEVEMKRGYYVSGEVRFFFCVCFCSCVDFEVQSGPMTAGPLATKRLFLAETRLEARDKALEL